MNLFVKNIFRLIVTLICNLLSWKSNPSSFAPSPTAPELYIFAEI